MKLKSRVQPEAPGLTGTARADRRTANLLGRLAPGDIAETIWFLASPGARHLTAQVLHLNGGALPTR